MTDTVHLTVTPVAGSILTRIEVERSDDDGATWAPIVGAAEGIVWDPGSTNMMDGSDFILDSDGNLIPDGIYAFSGSAAESGAIPAVHVTGDNAWSITRVGAGATRSFAITPHVDDVDNAPRWEVGHTYEISFELAASHLIPGTKPVITIAWPAGFAVTTTAVSNPDPTAGLQQYRFRYKIEAAGTGAPPAPLDVLWSYAGFTVVGDLVLLRRFMISEGVGAAAVWATRDGSMVVTDRFAPRGRPVTYRVRQVKVTGDEVSVASNITSYGTVEYASPWVETSPITMVGDCDSVIRAASTDVYDLEADFIGAEVQSVSSELVGVYWPEGRRNAVTVGGTVHGEVVQMSVILTNDDDWVKFQALRDLGEPLFFRTLFGDDHLEDLWLRIGPDVQVTRSGVAANNRSDGQLRTVTFTGYPADVPA